MRKAGSYYRIFHTQAVATTLASKKFTEQHEIAYAKFLVLLQSNELTKGLNAEMLDKKTSRVLSLRLEGTGRVIAKKITVNGSSAWLLLEMLLEHEYDRRKSYNAAHLAELTAACETAIDPTDDTSDHKPIVLPTLAPTAASADDAMSTPVEVMFYNKQVVHLTDNQQVLTDHLSKQLQQDHFIGLVTGAPGAGKTLLVFCLIEQLKRQEAATGSLNDIIYIASSERLRDEMQEQWATSTLCNDGNAASVSTCQYIELLHRFDVIDPSLTAVDDKDLHDYFDTIRAQQKTAHKASKHRATGKSLTTLQDIDYDTFYQECIIMASVDNLEAYLVAGRSHSLLHGNTTLQTALWQAFKNYQNRLTEKSQYHPALTRFDGAHKAAGTTLIIDEALDFTRPQLQTLMSLGVKALFTGDGNQDLSNLSDTVKFLKQQIPLHTPNPYIAKLGSSFRCSKNIAAVGSRLLLAKKKVMPHGSKLVDTELASALDDTGSVRQLRRGDTAEVKALCANTNTAVICSADNKTKAEDACDTGAVFTVEEIKGLGYDRIVLWNLITAKTATRLLSIIKREKIRGDDIPTEDIQLIEQLNHLFTALSRARIEVVFMQTATHPKVDELLAYITQDIVAASNSSTDKLDDSKVTDDDWLREADRLARLGKMQQAHAIRQRHGVATVSGAGLFTPPPHTVHAAAEEYKSEATTALPSKAPKEPKESLAATATSAIECELNIKLALTLSTASGKKKKKKARSRRVEIDFAKPITAKTVLQLIDAPSSQLSKLEPQHLIMLFLNRVDTKLEDYVELINSIAREYNRDKKIADTVNDSAYSTPIGDDKRQLVLQLNRLAVSKLAENKKNGIALQDTVIAKLMAKPETRLALYTTQYRVFIPTLASNKLMQLFIKGIMRETAEAMISGLDTEHRSQLLQLCELNPAGTAEAVISKLRNMGARMTEAAIDTPKQITGNEGMLLYSTLFMLATRQQLQSVVKALYKNNVYSKPPEVRLVLGMLAAENNIAMISFMCHLIPDIDLDKMYETNNTLVHIAATYNHSDLIIALHKLGANVSIFNDEGYTPMHIATRQSSLDCIKTLCSIEPSLINQGSRPHNETPGYIAARINSTATVKAVQEAGGCFDITETKNDYNAIYCAIAQDNAEVLQAIIDAGTNVDVVSKPDLIKGKNINSWTPLNYAAARGRVRMVQILCDAGCSVNAIDDHGCQLSAIHLATYSKSTETVKMLYQYGADINQPSHHAHRNPPLITAIKKRATSLALYLMELPEIDINITESYSVKNMRESARMQPDSEQKLAIIKRYSAGLDPDDTMTCNLGFLASYYKLPEIAELFEKKQAEESSRPSP